MERLTIRNSDGSVSQPTATTIQAVFEKLAAYEDTGLTPKEVKAKCAWADNVCKMLSGIFEDSGVFDFSHIKELITAEQEGRLVVLPCKVGDRVWGVEFDTSECPHCFGFGGCFGCSGAKPKGVYYFKFRLRDAEKIGKTVFLTRAEAEKAMEVSG